MNPFYELSQEHEISPDDYRLKNLGSKRIYASLGKRSRGGWGERPTYSTKHVYTGVTPEDYDNQFVTKLLRLKLPYKMDDLIEHHLNYYISQNPGGREEFMLHMRFVVLTELEKRKNSVAYVQCFNKWLDKQEPPSKNNLMNTVNNTINLGNINAPLQVQQSSDHAVQTQNNHVEKEQIKQALELIKMDIQHMDERIREDFRIEMNYAVAQLNRDRDVKPQLLGIGSLMKDVGVNVFAGLLASPIYEQIKPLLGL